MELSKMLSIDELIERADLAIEKSEEYCEEPVIAEEVSEEDISKVTEDTADCTLMEKFGKIVKGVARKYHSKWVNGEDLEQELWIKVLEMIGDSDGEDLDANLVAKACFRRAVDYYRYCRRRYEANCSYDAWTDAGDELGQEVDYSKLLKTHNLVKDTELVTVREVLELFPEDSKERLYIEMKLFYYGDLDPEYWDRTVILPEEGTAKDGSYKEVDFLKLLGYKGQKIPGSWIVKKNSMRQVIDNYLRGI